jgi:hypothetical protein
VNWREGTVVDQNTGDRRHCVLRKTLTGKKTKMKKYVIERDIPKVGSLKPDQLSDAAKTSNAALDKIGTDIHWLQSYVTADKTFCIYLAKDEKTIKRHAELSRIPAGRITEVTGIIDPTTAAN